MGQVPPHCQRVLRVGKNQCEALRALQSPPRVDGGWAQLCREHAVLVDGLSPWVPHSIAVLHWRWAKVAMLSWCVITVLMARGREGGGNGLMVGLGDIRGLCNLSVSIILTQYTLFLLMQKIQATHG